MLFRSAGGFALTIFLPIRSSLYACFPSAGIALAGSAWLDTAWSTAPVARRRRALAVGLALPLVLWQPVYRARHARLIGEAELSSRALSTIAAHVAEGRTTFVLEDDRTARPSLDSAFGTLAQDAVALTVGPSVRVAIEPPPTDAAYAALEPVRDPDVVLRLQNGALARVR